MLPAGVVAFLANVVVVVVIFIVLNIFTSQQMLIWLCFGLCIAIPLLNIQLQLLLLFFVLLLVYLVSIFFVSYMVWYQHTTFLCVCVMCVLCVVDLSRAKVTNTKKVPILFLFHCQWYLINNIKQSQERIRGGVKVLGDVTDVHSGSSIRAQVYSD